MGYAEAGSNQATNPKLNAQASRIEHDVELLKTLIGTVERTTERVVHHARALGYFEPSPEAKTQAPTPVITTLADALQALTRAIDHCSGSLNVFD
jgi:hypothetical protein